MKQKMNEMKDWKFTCIGSQVKCNLYSSLSIRPFGIPILASTLLILRSLTGKSRI